MRKILIAGLARFKLQVKGNYFLVGGNVFLINTKQNSFFKKKEVVVPEILKEEDLKQQAQQPQLLQPQRKEHLKDILTNYQHYFTQQPHNLPFFLQRLSKSLDQKISAKDISKLQDIYNKLNKCSSELSLKPIQYLQILLFIEKYMQLSSKQLSIRPVMANNGFEHRATMMTATFLLNNSLTVTQAIALFKIFTSIGSISNLFFANFTKFLKFQFQNERSKTSIKLEHILAILSNYFLKNNRTILENVLYDMTLSHLLSNPHLILSSSSPSLHVQLLTYLLRIDLKYFYMSQQRELVNCLKILTQKILLLFRNTRTKKCNNYYSIYLLESCDYFIASKNNNPEILTLVSEIINQIYKKYRSTKLTSMLKDHEVVLLSRLICNRRLFEMSINHNQIIKKIAEEMKDQESVYPLIDRFYDSDQSRAIQLLREIYQRKSSVFLPATSKIMLSISTSQEIATFWKEIIENNKKVWMQNHILLYSLLLYSKQKSPNLLQLQQIKELHRKLRQKMLKLSQNKYAFILSLFEAINLYRDANSCSSWLLQIIKDINLQDYLAIAHPKQAEHDNHQVRFITIAAFALFFQPSLAIPAKFNDHSMYTYLRTLFPLNHPTHTYTKPIHFLQSDESFKRNMEVMVRLTGNFQKYSYLLWDIFINNYIQRSQNVRSACFDLLMSLFARAFEKQAARRIVLLSNLTNYMSRQVIIASKSQLQRLFEFFLKPLVDEKIHERFHYHCFLQLTFNALSLGILSKQSFTKIIKRCLAANKCVPSSYKTSSLLLLYGMTMKNRDNVYSEFYFQQRKYIKYLLDNKLVKIANESLNKDQQQKLQNSNRKYVIAGSKFLCIILQYGQHQLLNISEEILNFVRSNPYFPEILQLHNSFSPQHYDLKDKNFHKFARSLNNTFEQKINAFYLLKQIRKETHSEVISKLIQNNHLINLFIQ